MPSSDREKRTPEEIAEHYRQKQIRREAQVAERDARRAVATSAREERRETSAKAKDERTTLKMQKRSDAYLKHWKKKLEREEDRRLKNRDERELSRLEARAAGVEERKQHTVNVLNAKEKAWVGSRKAEAEKHRKGDEVVRQIQAARPRARGGK